MRYEIIRVRTKKVEALHYDEVVTDVELNTSKGGYPMTKQEVIEHIEKQEHSFYIEQEGKEVKVVVVAPKHSGSHKYLRTEQDTTITNNLLSLPRF